MKQKIALCFLTYDNLSQPQLWRNFLDSRYTVYIHDKNTLSFMDKASSLYVNFSNFCELFEKLKIFCGKNNVDTKKICVTGSAVLSIYGIRDCNDIDLFIDDKLGPIFENTCFDNHNKYVEYYPTHYDDIIYNPDNYFYY